EWATGSSRPKGGFPGRAAPRARPAPAKGPGRRDPGRRPPPPSPRPPRPAGSGGPGPRRTQRRRGARRAGGAGAGAGSSPAVRRGRPGRASSSERSGASPAFQPPARRLEEDILQGGVARQAELGPQSVEPPLGDDPPPVQDQGPVAEPFGRLQHVGAHQNGRP